MPPNLLHTQMNLWERLVKVFIKMVLELIEILNIDMEEVIYKLLQNDSVSNVSFA